MRWAAFGECDPFCNLHRITLSSQKLFLSEEGRCSWKSYQIALFSASVSNSKCGYVHFVVPLLFPWSCKRYPERIYSQACPAMRQCMRLLLCMKHTISYLHEKNAAVYATFCHFESRPAQHMAWMAETWQHVPRLSVHSTETCCIMPSFRQGDTETVSWQVFVTSIPVPGSSEHWQRPTLTSTFIKDLSQRLACHSPKQYEDEWANNATWHIAHDFLYQALSGAYKSQSCLMQSLAGVQDVIQ